MAQFKHAWGTLDPQIDRLKQDGLDASAIARQLHIPRRTLTDHRPDLRKDVRTSQVPATVSRKVPNRYPKGTLDQIDASVVDLDALTEALKGRVLEAIKPAFHAWLAQQAPGQVPIWVPMKILDEVPGATSGEYLEATLGYLPDPQRNAQFHWHLPKRELWELRAVAQGLEVDMSLLLRKLWRAFMKTPEAQAGLERYRTGRDTDQVPKPGLN
jgi:hypothetical protein